MNTSPSISYGQIQETMARLSYFDGWKKDQLAQLAAGASQFVLAKKEKLVSKGDLIDSLYVVVSGQIRLFIPLSNGSERVISQVGRGESFGEPCMIVGQPCPYEAVAGRKCHILAIDGMVYRRALRQNPIMVERALSLVSERLLLTLRDMEICAQPSSIQRVARYLMQLEPERIKPELPDSAFEIRLPALKRDIAAKLGLSQETFSRMLAFMTKQGFIQVKGAHIRVDDRSKLLLLTTAGCPVDLAEKI
jgi:CRP/FNR family transcriptional regulator, dissimilatory nitrate respiration regulator